MALSSQLLHILLLLNSIMIIIIPGTRASADGGGVWALLQRSIGISAMHMQLLHTDRVVAFDRTDYGLSNISLPHGRCRRDPHDLAVKFDCTAHSVEYDPVANSVRPLMVLTDVWCSSGAVTPDGTLVQAGGFNDGDHAVRTFTPCRGPDASCDWAEISRGLAQRRWYATSHVLPRGGQVIIGGRRQFNYEFYPKTPSVNDRSYNLPFLVETNDPRIENNLYPFVFLNSDGNLFIFANNRAILFDYRTGQVVRTYPVIPGGDPRNYPSTGSAVLLPLKNDDALVDHEVFICGGAPKGAYVKALNREFVGALNTSGRIRINDPDPNWVMETMPMGRVMGDMVLLPNGDVLIVNGAGTGTAGWELGRNPVLAPVVYRPDNLVGSRFEVQNPSSIPRMYHSSAVLLRDGRVLVGGSNPHTYYNFTNVLFPTDLSMEAFSPSYLDPKFGHLRPRIIAPASQSKIGYGQQVPIRFTIPPGRLDWNSIMVTMVAPAFATHSFSMNQRLLVLTRVELKAAKSTYQIRVKTPGSDNIAPSGYYLVFVVHQDIPSEGIWVRIS